MGEDKIWLAFIEQDIGRDIVIPATTREVCRQRAMRTLRRLHDAFVEEWVEDFDEGTSELALTSDGRKVIIARRYLYDEPDSRPVDLDEATRQQVAGE